MIEWNIDITVRVEIIVPKRSNDFQLLIAQLHAVLDETGAKITESALLKEAGTEHVREIDVLIEGKISGYDTVLAIECRDRSRAGNVQWIDELIGKFQNLPVDKIVAISTSEFTNLARKKASIHRIECITASDPSEVDWASKFSKPLEIITHGHRLHYIGSFDESGAEIGHSTLGEDGNYTHSNKVADGVCYALWDGFMKFHKEDAERGIWDQIVKNIDEKGDDFDTSLDRYMELSVIKEDPIEAKHSEFGDFRIKKIVFGVVTSFKSQIVQPYSKVVRDRVVGKYAFETEKTSHDVLMVTDKEGFTKIVGQIKSKEK